MTDRAIERFEIDANRRARTTLTGRGDHYWKRALNEALGRRANEPFAYSTNEGDVIYVESVPKGAGGDLRKQLEDVVREANRQAEKYRFRA
jgi:hypothetical protein